MTALSPSQERIVKAPIGGAIQVLATAGSGKTRVLTERVRFILENTKRDGVLALTFTNKATDEMKSRLETVEGFEDRCWVTTIHAMAERILNQYGYIIDLPSNLQIYDREDDRKTIFVRSLQEDGIDINEFFEVREDKEIWRKIQEHLNKIAIIKRHAFLSDEEIKERHHNFYGIYRAYQKALIENGGIDFDDILVYAIKILNQEPRVGQIYRAKYKHVCVDEAQDLNQAQYKLIKTFCSDQIKSVMMVGDKNQMIYGFNGSSHDFLCKNFIADFAPQSYTLLENYRSSRAVIDLANKLKQNSQQKTNFAFPGESVINSFADEDEEADWICRKILELLAMNQHKEIEGNINLMHMAVLGRTRFVFSALEKKLQDNNISYALKKGERLASPVSILGQSLYWGIRIKVNPKNDIAKTQLNTIQNNFLNNKNELIELQGKMLTMIDALDIEEPNMSKFYQELGNMVNDLFHSSAIETLDDIELKENTKEIEEFKDYWITFRKKGLGKSLAAFCNALSLGELSEYKEQHGLTLSTIHTMKGLEKDIVFLIGMCEGVFPDYRAKTQAQLAEELNNAFVAVTRAKRWIYVTYPEQRMMPWGDYKLQQPSRYIVDLRS